MPPIVTCVMPAYNHEAYVVDAVRSVFQGQPPGLVRLIAIDDASADRTGDVLVRLARELPELTVLRNERNLGAVGTLRRGMDLVATPYVTGLASDDRWLPGRLETQLDALESGARWSFGRAHVIDDTGTRTSEEPQGWAPGPDGMLHMLLCGQAVYAPTLMYRKELLDDSGGLLDAMWEDLAMTLRFAASSEPAFHHEALVEYRVHGSNVHLDIVAARKHFAAHAEAVRLLLAWPDLPPSLRSTVADFALVWNWMERYAAGGARLGEARSLPPHALAAVVRRQLPDLLRTTGRGDAHRLEAILWLSRNRQGARALAEELGAPLWERVARKALHPVRRRTPGG